MCGLSLSSTSFALDSGSDDPDQKIISIATDLCGGQVQIMSQGHSKMLSDLGAAALVAMKDYSSAAQVKLQDIGEQAANLVFVGAADQGGIDVDDVRTQCRKHVENMPDSVYYFPKGGRHIQAVPALPAYQEVTYFCEKSFSSRIPSYIVDEEEFRDLPRSPFEASFSQETLLAFEQIGESEANSMLSRMALNEKLHSVANMVQACKALTYTNEQLRNALPAKDSDIVLLTR